MTTMTAFDQSGDWEDRIFGTFPAMGSPESPPHPAVNNTGLSTMVDDPPYIPYTTAWDEEREPVEIWDEDPRWNYSFTDSTRLNELKDDPYEEAGFFNTERIFPRPKKKDNLPRKRSWNFRD